MRICLLRRGTIAAIVLFLTSLLALRIIILLFFSSAVPAADLLRIPMNMPQVIIDAGHGGLDGGAVSPSGLMEAPLNLDISLRMHDLFAFVGVRSILSDDFGAVLFGSKQQTFGQQQPVVSHLGEVILVELRLYSERNHIVDNIYCSPEIGLPLF